MHSAKPISVIVYGSVGANEEFIKCIDRELGCSGWRADVICVGDCVDSVVKHSTLVGDLYVRTAPSVGDAVEMAYFGNVAIFQGRPALDTVRLQDLIRRLKGDNFIYSYQPEKASKGYKRVLMRVSRLLDDALLKSDVSPFDNAMLVFERTNETVAAIRNVVKSMVAGEAYTPPLGKLVSALKMTGKFRVISTQDEFAISETPAKRINSKSILSAIGDTIRTWWNAIMFPQPTPLLSQRSNLANRSTKIGAWVLLCLIAGLMLNQNLKFPFFEPDEARNAQLALNILDTGDWMSLKLKNDHYWDKPPLVAWMTAISFQTFGITENAARFPGVVVTFLLVILTCAIGQRLVGFRAAWIAALLGLLSLGIPFSGRYLTMDSTLALFATVTCLAAFRGSFCSRFRQAWWVLAGACVGLGLITKGPVILIICAPPVLLFSWLTGMQIFSSVKKSLYFVVPAALIGGPWFIATAIGTPEFLTHFLWQHHVVRFTEGISHQQPFWYYLPVILLLMFPASQLLLPLAKFIGTRKAGVRSQRTQAHGYLFLYAMWVLVFFTCSSAKLPTYILPVVPILCLLMASVIDINVFAKLSGGRKEFNKGVVEACSIDRFYAGLPKWLALNTAAWAIIVSLGIMLFLPEHTASTMVMVASLVLLIFFTAVATHKRSHPYMAWASVGVLGLFMSAMLVNHLIPAISQSRSIQLAVAEIQSNQEFADSPVVYYARDSFATSMVLKDSKVVYFHKDEATSAATFLKNHPSAILVTPTEFVEGIEKAIQEDVVLTKQESARHVYLASPIGSTGNSVRVATEAATHSKR